MKRDFESALASNVRRMAALTRTSARERFYAAGRFGDRASGNVVIEVGQRSLDNRGDVPEHAASECLGFRRQSTTLRVGEPQPSGPELLSEHAVLTC